MAFCIQSEWHPTLLHVFPMRWNNTDSVVEKGVSFSQPPTYYRGVIFHTEVKQEELSGSF